MIVIDYTDILVMTILFLAGFKIECKSFKFEWIGLLGYIKQRGVK